MAGRDKMFPRNVFVGAKPARQTKAGYLTMCSTVMLWLLAFTAVSAELSKKPIYAPWQLVAVSDLIVKARLHVPLSELKERLDTKKYGKIYLQAEVEEPLKGHPSQQFVSIYYSTAPSTVLVAPTVSFLEQHNDQEVILFLAQDSGPYGTGNYVFAGGTPDAARPFSAGEWSTIVDEVKNQREIAQHFDELPIGKTSAADARVRELFDRLTQRKTQEAAWEQLLKLSRQDVPAIVRVMNDHQRRIPDFDASVPNPPGFGEARTHNGATRVIEAASILLGYITQTGLGGLGSGSERDPFAEVNGWRVWCAYSL